MPCRLLPDDRDGIPNVLVEAMAAGAPVVASAVSGIPELVDDGVNGLTVAPGGPGGARRRAAPPAPGPRARAAPGGGGTSDGARALRRRRAGRRARRAVRAGGRAMRPVVCVIEHLHRDRERRRVGRRGPLHARGRDSRRSGRAPDWLGADLPADEEWRIEWVKFYYGLDLAHAYRTTGAKRFREAWERLVASCIAQVPPDHDSSDVTARRILNWIYAWQGFGAGALDARARGEHRRAGAPRARRRSRPSATTARSSCTRCCSPRSPCPGSTATAACAASRWPSSTATSRRTSAPTASTARPRRHYHMIALRSFLGVRANARRFGLALPDRFEDPARARQRVRAPLPPPGRPDPRALGRGHRRLPRAARAGGRAARPGAGAGRELPRRRLLRAAQRLGRRRQLRRLRLRPAGRRRPWPLRPSQRRAVRSADGR